jgi:hypothetical protein
MRDDEYARAVLSVDARARTNHDAQSNLPAIVRSLQRSNARGLAEYLATQTRLSTILGHDGRQMAEIIEPDAARLRAVGGRMIRAFHFVETGTPLPADALVNVQGQTSGLHRQFSAFAIPELRAISIREAEYRLSRAFVVSLLILQV